MIFSARIESKMNHRKKKKKKNNKNELYKWLGSMNRKHIQDGVNDEQRW